jgi:hypothetical protein
MIDILKKAGIVNKPSPKSGKPRPVNLTEIGKEIFTLIANVREYTESVKELDNAIVKQFPLLRYPSLGKKDFTKEEYEQLVRMRDDSTKKTSSILKNRDWSEDEIVLFINNRYRPPSGIFNLLDETPLVVIKIILYKYLILLLSELNDTAMAIIPHVVIELITNILGYVHLPKYSDQSEIQRILDEATHEALAVTDSVTNSDGFRYKFMNTEVFRVLNSIFGIVNPRKEFLERNLEIHTEYLREQEAKSDKKLNRIVGLPGHISLWNPSKTKSLEFFQELVKIYSKT